MKKVLCISAVLLLMCSQALASCGGSSEKWSGYIGVIAPASCGDSEDITAALEILRSHDVNVKLGESVYSMYGYFAGSDQLRADDVNNMFRDDEVKAILCVRGGYGATRVLDKLDYDMISTHRKPLIGFSDISALHVVLNERCGIKTIHGPMLTSLVSPSMNSEYTQAHFFAGLSGDIVSGEIPMPEGRKLEAVIPGQAEGIITGGNLTLIASLVGTPYELKGEGALLLLEEVGEKIYRIDRMLNQLWQNGLLQRVSGILLGDFVNCGDSSVDPESFTLDDVLRHYAELSGKPVIRGLPSGHGKYNLYLPFGVHAVMKANADGTASLMIDGSDM